MESPETAKIRKIIDDMAEVARTLPATMEALSTEISQCQDAIMDIEHWLELNDFPARVGGKMSKRIKELRKKRRDLKDNLMILTPIQEFLIAHSSAFKQMDRARGEVRKKLAHVNNNRHYSPRVLLDLFGQEPPVNSMSAAMKKAEG